MNANTVAIGDVWRKHGPSDWLKIVGIQMPGIDGYDGGLPGVSIIYTNIRGNWKRKQWFWPARSPQSFCESQPAHGRHKVAEKAKEAGK